ncbi:MAG: GIY-YIG nuclease superfamily protein [Parcubacteria group bacterium GW2011_GWA2_47_26]|nr:MAG: GIY-YIG nuclease superfamily protein [Parcubacteria group bacterium GW2011_GWA2_47_26]
MFYVYIVRSTKDKRWYTGFTEDLRKHLSQHNSNLAGWTKGRGPFNGMKNYASRRTIKRGGARFRTPSLFLVNKSEAAKRLRQPMIIKGRPEKG